MGLFKKIKKALKKSTGGLLGGDDKPKAADVAAPVAAPAATVEAPKDDVETDDEADTEASRKAAKAKGKKNLSVSRSGGSGLNI